MRVEVRVLNTQLPKNQKTFAKGQFAKKDLSFEQETFGEVLSITDLTRGGGTGGGGTPLARPPSPAGNEA